MPKELGPQSETYLGRLCLSSGSLRSAREGERHFYGNPSKKVLRAQKRKKETEIVFNLLATES